MTVVDMGKDKSYPQHEELLERILNVIYEYEGDLPVVSVLGILDLVKDVIKLEGEEVDE